MLDASVILRREAPLGFESRVVPRGALADALLFTGGCLSLPLVPGVDRDASGEIQGQLNVRRDRAGVDAVYGFDCRDGRKPSGRQSSNQDAVAEKLRSAIGYRLSSRQIPRSHRRGRAQQYQHLVHT